METEVRGYGACAWVHWVEVGPPAPACHARPPDAHGRTRARSFPRGRTPSSPRSQPPPHMQPMAHGHEPRAADSEPRKNRSQVAGRNVAGRKAQAAMLPRCHAAAGRSCWLLQPVHAQGPVLEAGPLDARPPASCWALGSRPQRPSFGQLYPVPCALCPVPCTLYPVPCPSSLNASGLSEHALMLFRIGAVGIQSPPPEPPDERLIWPFIAR